MSGTDSSPLSGLYLRRCEYLTTLVVKQPVPGADPVTDTYTSCIPMRARHDAIGCEAFSLLNLRIRAW